MFVGMAFELILGWFFDKVLGRRLWVYKKFSIKGYTSPLTLPFWGGGGIVFFCLARLPGL